MPNNVQLSYRNRWLKEDFEVYTQQFLTELYRYDFQLKAREHVQLKSMRVNDELFHTFQEDESDYEFALSSVKPTLSVTIDYELEGELQQELFMLNVDNTVLPSQDYLNVLQLQYKQWKDKFLEYVEVFEMDEIEFQDFYDNKNWHSLFQQFKNRLQLGHPDIYLVLCAAQRNYCTLTTNFA